ncbi:MAG: ImmA/IrrE family metallo-endopeptidase [Nitrospirota bacterium]
MAFVGSASLRETLALSTEARRQLPTWTDALRQLIAKAEDAEVMVMVSSVVGSNSHRKLDVDEFRGFALADGLAPLVFLNGADSKAAQMFTLAHELAHLWLQRACRIRRRASCPSSKQNAGATRWQRNC